MSSVRQTSAIASRRAFTLIELLTVIAIIGILAAIIIPVVGKVRATATKATCASNLRQLATGSLLYAADHRNLLPVRLSGADFKQPHRFAEPDYVNFKGYLGKAAREKIVMCPGPLSQVRGPVAGGSYVGEAATYMTYCYYNLKGIDPAFLTTYNTTEKRITRSDQITSNFPLWTCMTLEKSGTFFGHANPETKAPLEGQNVARSDASVKWVKGDTLIAVMNDGTSGNVYYAPTP